MTFTALKNFALKDLNITLEIKLERKNLQWLSV